MSAPQTLTSSPSTESWSLNPFVYRRRPTRVVMVGSVAVGGNNPLRVQSMTTTDTMNTQGTIDQILRLADVGCEIGRITAPTVLDAKNLEAIKSGLLRARCTMPIVADIHFRPDAAMIAADFVEKVRINPGNFVDGKAFKVREYTDQEYEGELARIEEKFTPLVLKLKRLNRALRIGTNHGSLSDRIMNRFGDTPLGMVESALEYVRICEKNDFWDIIISMKASNPRVMIAAYRLLAARMAQEGMDYPFHLGVTEAGDGEDGRIKSAAGIGSLLEDGIGDTIRVSLTEDPEFEIPVALELANRYSRLWAGEFERTSIEGAGAYVDDEFSPSRRKTHLIQTGPVELGSNHPIRVVSRLDLSNGAAEQLLALVESRVKRDVPPEIVEIPFTGEGFEAKYSDFRERLGFETQRLAYWVAFSRGQVPPMVLVRADGYVYETAGPIDQEELNRLSHASLRNKALLIIKGSDPAALLSQLPTLPLGSNSLIGLDVDPGKTTVHAVRALIAGLRSMNVETPVLLTSTAKSPTLSTAVVMGSLICDGIGDALSITEAPVNDAALDFSYNLLQACGNRIVKTEYVSCPSCGRTLFDLQSTTERIKSKTGHLKGVKIAIMGCIVNGPGEMADADFGYVGGGPGKINLYVGKTCVQKSIPSDVADEKLIDLIKRHGKWVEPPTDISRK